MTQWHTGDLITEEKMNALEEKVDKLLGVVNLLLKDIKAIDNFLGIDTDWSDIILPDMSITTAIINFDTLNQHINTVIDTRIVSEWPEDSILENNTDTVGDSTAIVTPTSLKNYIDTQLENLTNAVNTTYTTELQAVKNTVQQFHSTVAETEIRIFTTSKEKTASQIEESGIGNTISGGEVWFIPFGQGRMLIGAGVGKDSNNLSKTFNSGDTGGEYQHTLVLNEIPSHKHSISGNYYKSDGPNTGNAYTGVSNKTYINNKVSGAQGGGKAHNNLPPYITVFFYKRCTMAEHKTYYNIS